MEHKEFYVISQIIKQDWQAGTSPDEALVPPFFHFLITHYAYRDYCKEHHHEIDSFRCAVVYFLSKNKFSYDRIKYDGVVYNDYKTEGQEVAPYAANL